MLDSARYDDSSNADNEKLDTVACLNSLGLPRLLNAHNGVLGNVRHVLQQWNSLAHLLKCSRQDVEYIEGC